MKKGDIVLVQRFSTMSYRGRKQRPALILAGGDDDVIAALVTSKFRIHRETDVVLTPSPENGLTKKSRAMLSMIATLDRSAVIRKLGSLSKVERKQLDKMLARVFEIDFD
ncbi:MAG: type II toxin-antitoxin system PemK/MazF family toxin [Ignavibacteriae bacterium]|nr:type II toxin-antitoxin system PemK/MazF family toxin [Ignavibacteriota bacterium]